jgi:hypothetical protein
MMSYSISGFLFFPKESNFYEQDDSSNFSGIGRLLDGLQFR